MSQQNLSRRRAAVCLLLLLVYGAAATRGAAGPNDDPPPAYARLPARTVLALGYDRFVARYGGDKTGPVLDAVLLHFAACHAQENDTRAARCSPQTAAQIRSLRAVLEAWDDARFSPADAWAGGELERGHHTAETAVNRERALEQIVGLFTAGRGGGPVSLRRERGRLAAYLQRQKAGAQPSPDELDGKDADERQNVRARYRDWYARLAAQARRVETAANTLPVPSAGARILRYAATGK